MPALIRRAIGVSFVVVGFLYASAPAGQRLLAQSSAGVSQPWPCWANSIAATSVLKPSRANAGCATTAGGSMIRLAPLTTAAPIVVPGAPASLAAVVSGDTVRLNWSAASREAATSYVLEAGTASGRSDLANADTGSGTPGLTATAVPPGRYFMRVRARTRSGTSAPSNEIAVTVSGACSTAPDAPTGLRFIVTGSSVSLIWQSPVGGCAPTSYVLEAGSASGLNNLVSFNTGTASTTYAAAGVAAGTYYVRIRAADGSLTGAASNEVTVTVGGCTAAPSAPSGFTSQVSGTSVLLTWTASTGSPASYVLEAGSSPGSSNLVVSDTGTLVTSLVATAPAGTYYVRLRARNSCGTGAASTEITVVVGGTTPTAPTWVAEGVRLTDITAGYPGSLANPTAFQLRDGRWRLMISAGGGIRSWISTDGLTFNAEVGVRIANPGECGHGRAFRLDDTRIRVYCRNTVGILSMISNDEGLTFAAESGVLIPNSAVGATRLSTGGVVRTSDGRWRMYFSDESTASGAFGATRIFSASSSDLATWTVDPGVRIGAGATFSGTATHPSAIVNTDGSVSVFYTRFGLVPGEQISAVWVATSVDGLTFTSDASTGLTPGADPDIVALPGGGYRVYYNWGDNNSGVLYSGRTP